jgi:hypothetical protein
LYMKGKYEPNIMNCLGVFFSNSEQFFRISVTAINQLIWKSPLE